MTEERFNALIDHIGRVYESAKDGVYHDCLGGSGMKSALDGLQELRNIACENLIKVRDLENGGA